MRTNAILLRYVIPILLFFVSWSVFYTLYGTSDLIAHADYAKQYIDNGQLPGNFLYYWLISVVALGNPANLMTATLLTLSLFVVVKYWMVKQILMEKRGKCHNTFLPVLAAILLFLSAVYLPQLVFGRFYLGSFTPNLWHNSTSIVVMPFAVGLFWLTVKQIEHFSWVRLVAITALLALNAAIKPSYLFVYIAALPLTVVIIKGFASDWFKQAIPAITALLLVLLQSLMVYGHSSVYEKATVEIGFMKVYNAWHHIPPILNFGVFGLSLLTSIAYPVFVLFKKGIDRNDHATIFSWVSMAGALLVFVLFSESGNRLLHGNFAWQIYICSFILFANAARLTLIELSQKPLPKPNTYQLIMGLHLLFGIVYLVRCFITRDYL